MLGKFYWYILKFIDFTFCHLYLTIKPIGEFNIFTVTVI